MVDETANTSAKKPGRPPVNSDSVTLKKKVQILEAVIQEIAHYSGNNRILDKYNIERWEPGKNDMRKFKD